MHKMPGQTYIAEVGLTVANPREQIYGLSHSALAQTLARQIMREARTEHQRLVIIEAWKDLLVYLKAQNVVADSI